MTCVRFSKQFFFQPPKHFFYRWKANIFSKQDRFLRSYKTNSAPRIPAFFNFLKYCRQSIMETGWKYWRCPRISNSVQSQHLKNLEWQEYALKKSARSIKELKAFIHQPKYDRLRKLKHITERYEVSKISQWKETDRWLMNEVN